MMIRSLAALFFALSCASTGLGLAATFTVDAVRSHYGGSDTATAAVDALLRHGFANGFFEFLEDENGQPNAYQQSQLARYFSYNDRLGRAGGRNVKVGNAVYATAWWADKVVMVAGIATGGVAAGGVKAAVCGTVKALAVGYVVGEGLQAAVTYFDLDPRLIPAIEVAQVAVAALATRGGCFPEGTIVWVEGTVTGELMPIAIEDDRVGINRPDLSYTNPKTGQRVNIEYERTGSRRGAGHQRRILANDPNARVRIRENSN